MLRALVVEDDERSLRALARLVRHEGFKVEIAGSLTEAKTRLKIERVALVLTDLMLPDGSGLDLIEELGEEAAKTAVVILTGHASLETAVDALRRGATDYLIKPVDTARLKTVLANVARTHALKVQLEDLRGQLRELGRFGALIGGSPAMQSVYDLITRVAPTNATVLVSGESGTGKELVAASIHQLSRRAAQPFQAVNCGAISGNLIESELFGHERGSFTGAERQHKGHFERTDGGTLLLDEIGEMPLELQVKLLRVLETGQVQRVGGDKPVPIDVRIVAATNKDLDRESGAGKFREDLLYRLKVFPIVLPPLRDRGEDVAILAEYFLGDLNRQENTEKRWAPDALAKMSEYSWPGNVRELKNVVQRAYILADDEIGVRELPADVKAAAAK